MSNFLTKIILLLSLSVCFLSFSLTTIAQEANAPTETKQTATGDFTPLDPCVTFGNSCLKGIEQFQSEEGGISGILAFLQTGINIATYISVPIAVVFIIIGGYNMMNSQGDEKKYASGLNTIQYAIAGFVIILLAGTIIGLIIGFSKTDLNSKAGNDQSQTEQTSQEPLIGSNQLQTTRGEPIDTLIKPNTNNNKNKQISTPDNTVTTVGEGN